MIRTFLTSNKLFVGGACLVGISLFMKQGVVSVAFILFCVICLVNYKKDWTGQLKDRRLLLLPILLFGLYVIWSFVGGPPTDISSVVMKRATLLLFPVCFLVTGKKISEKEFDWILAAFLAACLVCSVFCYIPAFYNVIVNKSFVVHTVDRDYYYMAYIYLTDPVAIPPIYLSMMANMAVVIAVYTRINIALKWRIFIVIYLSIFVILLSSKIGIVCLVGLIALYVFKVVKQKKLAIVTVLLLVTASVIGVFTVPFLKERFLGSLKFDYSQQYGHLWNSNAYRMAVWSSALETIEENPVVGYGTGRGQAALEDTYRKHNFVRGLEDSLNPHNEFLACMLDLGISGVIALVLMIAVPMVSKMKEGDWLTVQFLIIFLCYCLIEVILNRQKGVVFISFFYSLLLWYPTAKQPQKSIFAQKF